MLNLIENQATMMLQCDNIKENSSRVLQLFSAVPKSLNKIKNFAQKLTTLLEKSKNTHFYECIVSNLRLLFEMLLRFSGNSLR